MTRQRTHVSIEVILVSIQIDTDVCSHRFEWNPKIYIEMAKVFANAYLNAPKFHLNEKMNE